MDIHPSGFPGLVGPEGGYGFSNFDYSSHFRVLPSNSAADVSVPCQENLAVRSHLHPPHLQASPSNNSTPRLSQPLCIREDNGKNHNGSSRGNSPRAHHLLSDSTLPGLGCCPPAKRFVHSTSAPARLASAEAVKHDEGDLVTEDGFDQNGDPLVLGF